MKPRFEHYFAVVTFLLTVALALLVNGCRVLDGFHQFNDDIPIHTNTVLKP